LEPDDTGDGFSPVPVIELSIGFCDRAPTTFGAHVRPYETNVIDLTKGVTQ